MKHVGYVGITDIPLYEKLYKNVEKSLLHPQRESIVLIADIYHSEVIK